MRPRGTWTTSHSGPHPCGRARSTPTGCEDGRAPSDASSHGQEFEGRLALFRYIPRRMDAPLPSRLRDFAALVRAARTEQQREQLRDRIHREFPRPGRRVRPIERATSTRLLEQRLLEFVRVPAASRQYGWELQNSHFEAWRDLVRGRSRGFARMLRVWMRGPDALLAAEAAEHLAWMGLDTDRSRIIRSVLSGPWRMRAEIAQGLGRAALHRQLSRRFRQGAFEAICRVLTGPDSTATVSSADEAFGNFADALLALDRSRGRAMLSGPRVLRPDSTAIRMVMLRLSSDREDHPGAYRTPIDPALLWPIYEALRDGRLRLPTGMISDRRRSADQAMGVILTFTADGDPVRTVRECRPILRRRPDGYDTLKEGARLALKRCRKVPEPDAVLRAFWRNPRGFDRDAASVARAYELLDHYHGDGLSLYFCNLGEHWRGAHAGLELVGAEAAARVVRDAAGVVEAFGKVHDRRSATGAHDAMDAAARRRLERLDGRFGTLTAGVLAAIERYIGRYPRDFPT